MKFLSTQPPRARRHTQTAHTTDTNCVVLPAASSHVFMLHSCLSLGNSTALLPRSSGSLDVSAPKLLQQVLAGAQGEGHDADGGGFVRTIEKDAGVASVQIRNIVSLSESAGDEFLWVMPHTACAGVVEAPT